MTKHPPKISPNKRHPQITPFPTELPRPLLPILPEIPFLPHQPLTPHPDVVPNKTRKHPNPRIRR